MPRRPRQSVGPITDLRNFLAQRSRRDLGFLVLAAVLTGLVVALFYREMTF